MAIESTVPETPERLSWNTIDYSLELPNTFIIPEHHWPLFQKSSLSAEQKIRLNHFATFYTCEMFTYFEDCIIEYIELNRKSISKYLSEKQINRFIEEEHDHSSSFMKLATKIRPDICKGSLTFLKPTKLDRLILKSMPLLPFFITATLFEETTVFVYTIMQENLEQSWKPVLDAMKLHAIEEKGHIGMDKKVVNGAKADKSKWKIHLEMLTIVPFLAYSEKKILNGWKEASTYFAKDEKLSSRQTKEILNRGLSASDKMGIRSFLEILKNWKIAGSKPLLFALSTSVRSS